LPLHLASPGRSVVPHRLPQRTRPAKTHASQGVYTGLSAPLGANPRCHERHRTWAVQTAELSERTLHNPPSARGVRALVGSQAAIALVKWARESGGPTQLAGDGDRSCRRRPTVANTARREALEASTSTVASRR